MSYMEQKAQDQIEGGIQEYERMCNRIEELEAVVTKQGELIEGYQKVTMELVNTYAPCDLVNRITDLQVFLKANDQANYKVYKV